MASNLMHLLAAKMVSPRPLRLLCDSLVCRSLGVEAQCLAQVRKQRLRLPIAALTECVVVTLP